MERCPGSCVAFGRNLSLVEVLMKEIYILQGTERGYYRENNYCYPFEKQMVIQNASIFDDENSWPKGRKNLPTFVQDSKLIFIELSFDPISRIKRGMFYELSSGGQPCSIYPYSGMGGVYQISASNPQSSVQAYKFQSYDPTKNFNIRKTFILFGNSRFKTRWKVLSVDAIVTNEEVYVLQEINSIGAIPTLNTQAIPSDFTSEISHEYEALLRELNSSPESVIDHCRDVATSLLSAMLDTPRHQRVDLGDLLKKVDRNLKIVKSSAEIINCLHPRRKPNERDKLSLNDLTRADSDFAVQCVFQIIRELRWNQI